MKKVLAIFMAIIMIATMFSFSTIAFAEDEEGTTAPAWQLYLGGRSTISALTRDRRTKKIAAVVGNPQQGLHIDCLNADSSISEVTAINEEIIQSGEYSSVNITVNAAGAYDNGFVISGIKGTADMPVVLSVAADTNGNVPTILFENIELDGEEPAPTIILKDCEYVTLKDISVKSATSVGMVIEGCKNVTVENIKFDSVCYVDYSFEEVINAETGETRRPAMETAPLTEKGAALLVGEGNTDLTISGCSFTKCRAGIVSEAGETASTGVKIENATFADIPETAILLKDVESVTVSGGSVTNAGTIANASDFDNRALAAIEVSGGSDNVIENMEVSYSVGAAVAVNGAKNTTVQKMYSHDNGAFMTNALAADANVRIRYNVSVNDGASSISTAEASKVLVYNNTFSNAGAIDMSNISGLTVMNNIFSMAIGEKVTLGEGEFDANCYHWTSKAKGDSGSIKKNPQFANQFDAADLENSVRDNYILSSESPCLGKGVQVEDDMGATDFYGNEIGSSHNIGADEGAGAEASYKLVSQFVDTINYIFAIIRNFFANLFG